MKKITKKNKRIIKKCKKYTKKYLFHDLISAIINLLKPTDFIRDEIYFIKHLYRQKCCVDF